MEGLDELAAAKEKISLSDDFVYQGNEKDDLDSSQKIQQIGKACEDSNLRELATLSIQPGGFLRDELRRKTWPLVLGISPESGGHEAQVDWHTLPKHRDESQVELDVNRSFVYYPDSDSEFKLESRRARLSDVVVATLRRYPMLCYFQGYHDIVQVMLLVLGHDLALSTTSRLSILRIRDFMLPVLSPSLRHLQLLPSIISAVDMDLAKHLASAQPFFALSSTLTMFAHDIEDYQMIARLFDFLLAHEASLSMYLFATIILSRRKELFEIEVEDADMLHFTLSKLPKSLNMDDLIIRAMDIFEKHPPETLPLKAWAKISPYSVLKTTRSVDTSGVARAQTLDDGITAFQKQAEQVNRQELVKRLQFAVWKYRQPIGGIALTVLVGLVSIWLQKNENGYVAHFTARLSSFLRN